MRTLPLAFSLSVLLACSSDNPAPDDQSPAGPVPAEPQRSGDAHRGYLALVNNGYVSCGVPWSAWSKVFSVAKPDELLPERTGHSAELPYLFTAFTAKSGVEVVAPNCLSCHAGRINGTLVVGLGDASGDFTQDPSGAVVLAGGLLHDPAEIAEWSKFKDRMLAIAPYVLTRTVGVNPADSLAAVLFAHRDPATLAWSDDPLLELPPAQPVPVDVPPWWRMGKKNAMFYNSAGRGDHARIMMTASTLCTDSVDEARQIDAYFGDVEAYITSLRPPAWPFPVDAALAARGRPIYEQTCARCHGTYGDAPSYPNLVVALEDVGTDRALTLGGSQFAERFIGWFRQSFYGETARLQPAPGYVAPPLDGIWATAPFLHNGSVPTVAALLDSGSRPRYWTRTFDSTDYDPQALGWRFTALDHGQADQTDPAKAAQIYDTTLPGYSNGGHTYGDALGADERAAVIEYLKTL